MRPAPRRIGLLIGTALAAVAIGLTAATPATATDTAAPHASDPIGAPPGANDWSCTPTAAHPYPVVLVHGTFANRYDNWIAASPMLAKLGYCVYALDYGGSRGNIIQGIGPVADSAAQLADFVDRVLGATGADKVDIVGHSQGGMMPRYYLKFGGGADLVHALVGLAPSNHGTDLDGIANLAKNFPGAADLVYSACPACRDQVRGSDTLQRINADGDTMPGVSYTVISTRYDEVVTPYTSQTLSGPDVTNIVLQDDCPVDLADHVAIAFDPTALHEVRNALDPTHSTPVTCG